MCRISIGASARFLLKAFSELFLVFFPGTSTEFLPGCLSMFLLRLLSGLMFWVLFSRVLLVLGFLRSSLVIFVKGFHWISSQNSFRGPSRDYFSDFFSVSLVGFLSAFLQESLFKISFGFTLRISGVVSPRIPYVISLRGLLLIFSGIPNGVCFGWRSSFCYEISWSITWHSARSYPDSLRYFM